MRQLLYIDETLDLDVESLAAGLNAISIGVEFAAGSASVEIPDKVIRHPNSHKRIVFPKGDGVSTAHSVFVATRKPYDNNYFYEFSDNIGVIAFNGWDYLTSLPEINGLAFFIAALLAEEINPADAHDRNRGCINDFLWDKKGVDVGMRSAFLCPDCRLAIDSSPDKPSNFRDILKTVDVLLDQICLASRTSQSVIEYWQLGASARPFDVFLCHNSEDKEEIYELNDSLKDANVTTWLDEEQLQPGKPWQTELEAQIESIRSVAVCVGSAGFGPWQNVELMAFIQEFVRRGCPVIPVVLPTCPDVPQLPLFLRQFMWVDLRKKRPDPMKQLLWGITGRKQNV